MKTSALLASIPFLFCGAIDCAAQSPAAYRGALTVTIENDVATGSDNNYTNGFGFTWVSNAIDTYEKGGLVRGWGDFWSFLPFVGNEGTRTYVAWTLAQEMHTPDDIKVAIPPPDDQPYAGVLYLDSTIYVRQQRWTHAWQLRLGVVGPASQADNVQTWFHQWTGSNKPMGWDTQLPNEPVINVGYTGTYMLAQGDLGRSASWRIIPMGSAAIGNYFTGVGLGLYGEVGWNLVDAIGGTGLRQGFNAASTVGVGPVKGWSVSLSGGVMGYGVVQYLPLDGTLFRDSQSVDTKPFIGMATLGIAVRHGGFTGFFGKTYFTKTFDTERLRPEFGTLSLSWYF